MIFNNIPSAFLFLCTSPAYIQRYLHFIITLFKVYWFSQSKMYIYSLIGNNNIKLHFSSPYQLSQRAVFLLSLIQKKYRPIIHRQNLNDLIKFPDIKIPPADRVTSIHQEGICLCEAKIFITSSYRQLLS